jgi:hypothetical protein
MNWEPDLPWVDGFTDFRGYTGNLPRFCYVLTSYTYFGEHEHLGLRWTRKYDNEPTESDISAFIARMKENRQYCEARDFIGRAKAA